MWKQVSLALLAAFAWGCTKSVNERTSAQQAAAAQKQAGYVPVDPSPMQPGTAAVPPGTIGTLKWEVYDVKTGDMVSSGDRTFTVEDVTIDPVADYFSKTIELGDHFTLSVSGTPTGFALQGMRDDAQTFSWDWFSPQGDGRATKLQENGELYVQTVNTKNGQEIAQMEFLTDVSLRVDDMSKYESAGDVKQMNVYEPAWRIKIYKGSVIVWPARIDGKVVGV